jgi:hypothetical protein
MFLHAQFIETSSFKAFVFARKTTGSYLYGYVIMSNHIYLIVQSSDGKLSGLIRDIKAFSTKKILATIKEGPESRSDRMLKKLTFCGNVEQQK